jgi:kumamolisin
MTGKIIDCADLAVAITCGIRDAICASIPAFGRTLEPNMGNRPMATATRLCGTLAPRLRTAAALSVLAAVPFAMAPTWSAAAEPLEQLGAAPPALSHSDRLADADPGQQVQVQLALNLRDQAGLKDLVNRVSDPGSPDYGHHLTPQQVGDRFGPTAPQVQAAAGYLQASGLTVTSATPGSILVEASGTISTVRGAMHTSIGKYRDRADGREFYANDGPPSLPSSLAASVQAVHGLDNHAVRHHVANPSACCASAPFSPSQIRTGYNFTSAPLSGLTGGGQTMGLMELNTFSQSNVSMFDSTYGISPPTPSVQTVPGNFGELVSSTNGGEIEVELDIEVMQGIAPGANIMVFEAPNSNTGVNNAYTCMTNSTPTNCPNHGSGITPPSNSTSWGLCEQDQGLPETQTLDNIFQSAAATGHSLYAASGDLGSNDGCQTAAVAVDSPASDPYVTGTGGTKLFLNQSSNTWNNETAWPAEPQSNLGSGGGLSVDFGRPSWQKGPGVSNGFSNGMRQVPDVSSNSDPVTGFSIYTCNSSSGSNCVPAFRQVGGTSAAAPAWAAFTAIYNGYVTMTCRPLLGFANPALYNAFQNPGSLQPFHDITSGSNANNAPFLTPTAGWDYLTGIGSFNASQLAQSLAAVIASPRQVLAVTGGDNALYVQANRGGYCTYGGYLLGAPAVVSVPNGSVGDSLFIVTGGDHDLWIRSFNSGWQRLDSQPGAYCIDNPAATVIGSTLYVACQGGDRGLYLTSGSVTPGVVPTFGGGFTALGGNLSAGPAMATVPGHGQGPDIMVVNSDRSVSEWYSSSFHPTGWGCIGHAALATGGGVAYFSCHGLDNAMWWSQNSGSVWAGAASLGGYLIDGTAIAVNGSGPTFFVEGGDQAAWERTIGSGWTSDGGVLRYGAGGAALP